MLLRQSVIECLAQTSACPAGALTVTLHRWPRSSGRHPFMLTITVRVCEFTVLILYVSGLIVNYLSVRVNPKKEKCLYKTNVTTSEVT